MVIEETTALERSNPRALPTAGKSDLCEESLQESVKIKIYKIGKAFCEAITIALCSWREP